MLLAHDPRRLAEAAALRIPLVLSGHTHGGQVVLPVIGAVAARKFPVVAGVARQDETTIFVSRGIGTVYVPVRINCPPEVALLTLATARERLSVMTGAGRLLALDPIARTGGLRFASRPRAPSRSPPDRAGALRPGSAPTACPTVSSSATGTAACRTIGPSSSSGVTKWTVAPLTRTPCASACAWASRPGNDGSSDGWMFRIRFGKRLEQRSADEPHEPGETDEPDVVRLQGLRQRLIVGVTRADGRAAASVIVSMPASRARDEARGVRHDWR